LDAIEEMNRNVDALIVIYNELLRKFYPGVPLVKAFDKPNEVLAMAVKSIAEIITVKGIINRDFNDVTSIMQESGVSLVSYGFGSGENRLDDAIQNALDSPLLNNNDINSAQRILFYISLKEDSDFTVEELTSSMNDFMGRFDNHIKLIWGFGIDNSLNDEQDLKFTVIATGFGIEAIIPEFKDRIDDNIEKRKRDDERVEKAYGTFINTHVRIPRFSPSSIVVLTAEELDYDALINYMENNPTYNRSAKDISKYRIPQKSDVQRTSDVAQDENPKKATVINF
jgi:cell division protein FtsZ